MSRGLRLRESREWQSWSSYRQRAVFEANAKQAAVSCFQERCVVADTDQRQDDMFDPLGEFSQGVSAIFNFHPHMQAIDHSDILQCKRLAVQWVGEVGPGHAHSI